MPRRCKTCTMGTTTPRHDHDDHHAHHPTSGWTLLTGDSARSLWRWGVDCLGFFGRYAPGLDCRRFGVGDEAPHHMGDLIVMRRGNQRGVAMLKLSGRDRLPRWRHCWLLFGGPAAPSAAVFCHRGVQGASSMWRCPTDSRQLQTPHGAANPGPRRCGRAPGHRPGHHGQQLGPRPGPPRPRPRP